MTLNINASELRALADRTSTAQGSGWCAAFRSQAELNAFVEQAVRLNNSRAAAATVPPEESLKIANMERTYVALDHHQAVVAHWREDGDRFREARDAAVTLANRRHEHALKLEGRVDSLTKEAAAADNRVVTLRATLGLDKSVPLEQVAAIAARRLGENCTVAEQRARQNGKTTEALAWLGRSMLEMMGHDGGDVPTVVMWPHDESRFTVEVRGKNLTTKHHVGLEYRETKFGAGGLFTGGMIGAFAAHGVGNPWVASATLAGSKHGAPTAAELSEQLRLETEDVMEHFEAVGLAVAADEERGSTELAGAATDNVENALTAALLRMYRLGAGLDLG